LAGGAESAIFYLSVIASVSIYRNLRLYSAPFESFNDDLANFNGSFRPYLRNQTPYSIFVGHLHFFVNF